MSIFPHTSGMCLPHTCPPPALPHSNMLLFQTHIHVMERNTGRSLPIQLYTDAMVVFHHVNAYEQDGCLLVDVIAYSDSSLLDLFYLANLNQDFAENAKLTAKPTLKRFAVPLCAEQVSADISRERDPQLAKLAGYFGGGSLPKVLQGHQDLTQQCWGGVTWHWGSKSQALHMPGTCSDT